MGSVRVAVGSSGSTLKNAICGLLGKLVTEIIVSVPAERMSELQGFCLESSAELNPRAVLDGKFFSGLGEKALVVTQLPAAPPPPAFVRTSTGLCKVMADLTKSTPAGFRLLPRLNRKASPNLLGDIQLPFAGRKKPLVQALQTMSKRFETGDHRFTNQVLAFVGAPGTGKVSTLFHFTPPSPPY